MPTSLISPTLHRLWPLLVLTLSLSLFGCKDKAVEEAIDSDANGYLCAKCGARFYTVRSVFPNACPQCKQGDIEQVLGFVCPADKHVTVGSRSRRGALCEKCRKPTSGVSIPREADLKAWGAQKKTAAEVGA